MRFLLLLIPHLHPPQTFLPVPGMGKGCNFVQKLSFSFYSKKPKQKTKPNHENQTIQTILYQRGLKYYLKKKRSFNFIDQLGLKSDHYNWSWDSCTCCSTNFTTRNFFTTSGYWKRLKFCKEAKFIKLFQKTKPNSKKQTKPCKKSRKFKI